MTTGPIHRRPIPTCRRGRRGELAPEHLRRPLEHGDLGREIRHGFEGSIVPVESTGGGGGHVAISRVDEGCDVLQKEDQRALEVFEGLPPFVFARH